MVFPSRALWLTLSLLAVLFAACAPTVAVTPVGELPAPNPTAELTVFADFAEVTQPYRELATLSASRYETDFSEAWLRERLVEEAAALGADAVVLFETERSVELRPVRVGYERGDDPFGNDIDSIRFGGGQGYQEVVTLILRGVALAYTAN